MCQSKTLRSSPATTKYFVINPGGGVFVAVHNSIIATLQAQLDCQAEALWIKIEMANQKPLCIASFYRPPGSDIQPFDAFNHSLDCLHANGFFPRIVIAGDMNVPDINWSNNTVKDDPQYGVLVNQKFLNIVDDHGLTQPVSFPTRQASVLDLVVVKPPDLVSNLTSSDGISGINDHSAVSFELNLTVKVSKKKPRSVYKFAKANLEDIHHDAEILNKNFFKRDPINISIEDKWQFFKSGLLSILDSRVPRKKIGSWNDSSWITRDLKRLLRKKKRLYNTYKKSGKIGDKLKISKIPKSIENQI